MQLLRCVHIYFVSMLNLQHKDCLYEYVCASLCVDDYDTELLNGLSWNCINDI